MNKCTIIVQIMDSKFLDERILSTKQQIIAHENAVIALGSQNIQVYTIDTGQTRQTVTRLDLKALQSTIDGLYNRLATLQARRYGNGVTIGAPSW